MIPPDDASPLPTPNPITAQELLADSDSTTPKWKRVLLVVGSIFLDAIVPVAFYFILRIFIDPMLALLISGIPALLIFIVKMIWKRQVSVIAIMTFIAFVVSAIAAFAIHDPRILLLEGSLVMGVVGAVHVITLCPFTTCSVAVRRKSFVRYVTVSRGTPIKPFLFYVSKQFFPMGNMNTLFTEGILIDKYQWLWENIPKFRLHLRLVTGIIGISLVLVFVVKVIMIFSSLTVDQVMLYSNILFVIIMSLSLAFCAVYVFFAKRSFYKHVDKWIAHHYLSNQSMGVIAENSPLL